MAYPGPFPFPVSAGGTSYTSNPAFSSYQQNGASEVTGDGTLYSIVCDYLIIDNFSNYSVSTGLFTAPFGGNYYFYCTIALNGITDPSQITSSSSFVVTDVFTNTYNFNAGNLFAIGPEVCYSGSLFLYLNAGDTVGIQVVVNGSSKSVNLLGAEISTYYTMFGGYLLLGSAD